MKPIKRTPLAIHAQDCRCSGCIRFAARDHLRASGWRLTLAGLAAIWAAAAVFLAWMTWGAA